MGTLFVYNDIYAGKCYWTEKRSRISSVFSYDEDYLSGENNWNIDPSLLFTTGTQPSKHGLPGAFRDAAPDRWGQALIRYRLQSENKKRGKSLRALNEIDYLLGVNDSTRQGNLRFTVEKGSTFQHPSDDIPKLIELPKLMDAAFRYAEEDDENAIKILLEAGSASLGGARPKAAVKDGENLYIAKFPHRQDKWDVIAWEWVCLNAAAEAGIRVPVNKLVRINNQNILLVKRFDRIGDKRIGYISAMTLLDLTDGEQADYYEIADKLRSISISTKEDLMELYRRIAFFMLINNTDDHLRNHGFIQLGSGWTLSPAFDINPNPERNAIHATSIFGAFEKVSGIAALRENAQAFDQSPSDAKKIFAEVSAAIKSCEKYAKQAGISKAERELMLNPIN